MIAQYQRQGRVCAYCKKPCDGLPEPEHVIPLSRGGTNAMSNVVAACSQCNSSKTDMLLHEWQACRARKQLPPIDAKLDGPAYTHLDRAHWTNVRIAA